MAEDQSNQNAGNNVAQEGAVKKKASEHVAAIGSAGSAVTGLEVRVAMLEAELQTMKNALYAIPGALEQEKRNMAKSQQDFKKLQSSFKEISAVSKESFDAVNHLQKRVESVKKESTSGVVISVVVFSILLVVSMFIRA